MILGVCWVLHVCIYCFVYTKSTTKESIQTLPKPFDIIWGKYTIQRLDRWDTQLLMAHFSSQHFLSWRTVNMTEEAQKINNQHPSLRCNHCILIKQVTLTFQALHIISLLHYYQWQGSHKITE